MNNKVLSLYKLQLEYSVINGLVFQANDMLDITRELLSEVCLIPLGKLLELEDIYIKLPYYNYLNKDITDSSTVKWDKLMDKIERGIDYIEYEINKYQKQIRLEAELALIKMENEILLKEKQQNE